VVRNYKDSNIVNDYVGAVIKAGLVKMVALHLLCAIEKKEDVRLSFSDSKALFMNVTAVSRCLS